MLTEVQKHILERVAGLAKIPDGAINIRSDGKKAYRHNSEHIRIESKTDKDGIDIHIDPGTKGETVYIPVVITADIKDMVYNDFFVGEGADVTIVAGCGIHNGGKNVMNPETIVYLGEHASMTMDTTQIKGVDDTKRYTKVVCQGAGAEIIINEKLLTHGDQHAVSEMDVILDGKDSKTRVVSRSVAKENSSQIFYPRVTGNAPCFGHVSCDSIIMDHGKVRSIPELTCNHVDAGLIHEAAIGKIAGDQILKLETLGLTAEEAEEKILEGFLR